MSDRLEAAERFCILFGWIGEADDTDRGKAMAQAWHEWARIVKREEGPECLTPQAHPELGDRTLQSLADRRKTSIMQTLEAIQQERKDRAS